MTNNMKMRSTVLHAIGGGWGDETSSVSTSRVAVIRGADFPAVAVGDTRDLPRRWEKDSKLPQRLLLAEDIVLEISGGTSDRPTGRSVFISQRLLDEIGIPAIPASFCKLVRIDRSVADPYFVYWCLQNMFNEGRAWNYQNRSTGIANFQFEYFLDQEEIPGFPLEEQRAIASTLGALDDKIESNHRAAKKLNQLADAIADKMLASEPTRSVPLSALAHFNTRSLRKGQFDKIEYVDIKQTAHGFVKGTTIFDLPDAPSRARRLVQDGDVIYSTVRPSRHVFAPLYNPPKNLVVSTGFAVASPTALTGSSFLTYVFSDSTFAKYLASAAGGSAYPAVDVDVIEGYEAEIPQNVSALREYEESTITMRRYAHEFREENRRLSSLRDTLLPELMSGRIRVRITEVSG